MARLPQGILGPLVGSAGPVSGYLRLGQPVLRSKRRQGTYKATPARRTQQRKLQVVLPFIQAFTGTGFFKKSFPLGTEGSTGYNRALSQAMNSALVSSGSDFSLSYPQVLVARGGLPKAEGATVVVEADGRVRFGWTDNSATGKAQETDLVLLVVFCPVLEQVICAVGPNRRSEGEAVLVAKRLQGQVVETWIGFINEEETDAADSVYVGSVPL